MSVTVLLVEDHLDSRTVLGRILESRGYQVQTAGTYAEALRHITACKFDVLLSDVLLPDGDGCDLMLEARRHCAVRGIALTAGAFAADIARCRAAGFDEVLVKPIRLGPILTAVEQVIAAGPHGIDPSPPAPNRPPSDPSQN